MTVPGIVQSTLEGEEIATRVSLGGDDELFITPSRTIIYRAEGLLSDESVDEFPHDADRLTLSEGRRKTTFTLEYSIDGEQSFSVPASRTDDVLHPVLAGVLTGNEITDPGETVHQTFRFSELTLIITSDRVVKHIGEAVWDSDYEGYHYDDVTNLSFEDGSVATQIVLETDGRQQRVKAPNDRADEVCERLKRALFAYYDVSTLEELNAAIAPEDDESASRSPSGIDFGAGVDPLDANPPEPEEDGSVAGSTDSVAENDPYGTASGRSDETTTTEYDESTTGPSGDRSVGVTQATAGAAGNATHSADPEVVARIESLEAAVEAQTELLESQQRTIEQLIQELKQGR